MGASLSVAVQRVVFAGIARCIPALVLPGRLGRPLSEEPEFFRAAPGADCVDWVAAELGLAAGAWKLPARGWDQGDWCGGGLGGS